MHRRVWGKALHLHRELPCLTLAWRAEFTTWWLDKKTDGEYIGNFNTNALKGVLPNPYVLARGVVSQLPKHSCTHEGRVCAGPRYFTTCLRTRDGLTPWGLLASRSSSPLCALCWR